MSPSESDSDGVIVRRKSIGRSQEESEECKKKASNHVENQMSDLELVYSKRKRRKLRVEHRLHKQRWEEKGRHDDSLQGDSDSCPWPSEQRQRVKAIR